MKIDFKSPRYALPVIVMPFLFLGFYCFKSFAKDTPETTQVKEEGLKTEIVPVSEEIRKRELDTKLDAYKNQYKEGDGYTAISNLEEEGPTGEQLSGAYNEREKFILDSIDLAMKSKYGRTPSKITSGASYSPSAYSSSSYRKANNSLSKEDRELANALAVLNGGGNSPKPNYSETREADPMTMFREQMRIIDSMGKANDPSFQEQKRKEELLTKIDKQVQKLPKLGVVKATDVSGVFNTVQVKKNNDFIKAIVDENMKGYMGSRLRIRLLDDIKAGNHLIKKGTYVYALISGFEAQRVKLSITSIMTENKILPIKLDLFDLDGMEGLYVPASAFREFSKDLGGDMGQGVTMQSDPQSKQQLYMSTLQRIFTSTSQAVSKAIRQNKARIKYNTYVYLIDPDELKQSQQNY